MNSRFRAFFTLFAGLSFMCFSAIFVKSSHAPGIVTAFYRMAIGSVVLIIPFLVSLWATKKTIPPKGILFAVIGGFCFACDMGLWTTAVVMSNATIPTLMANLAPVWVGFGSILIFKQKHKIGFWLGIIIAIVGMVVMVYKDLYQHDKIVKGTMLGFGAGIFYGIFYLVSEPGRKLLNTLQFLAISTFSSTLLLFTFMLIFQYNFTGYDQFTYIMFLGIGVGVQVCGWFLINYSQGFLPATIVAPTLLGQPVLTAILAVLLLNEILTSWHVTGGIVVIAGIYMVYFSSRNHLK